MAHWFEHEIIESLLVCRACWHWSAPYDGIDPPPQEFRSDTPGDDVEDEDVLIRRVKSDSICSLVITPPPIALSPTLSSTDTVSTGNLAGRASSALELEWDDIFADEDMSLSAGLNMTLPNGGESPTPPPLPPRHIQEMRLNATKLVRGSYVEESEFQDDVLVYDLVAQKDTKGVILERIKVANRRSRGSISKGQRASTAATTTTTISALLTTTGRTVIETVNSIMSTRRLSEDGGKEERRWSEDYIKVARRRRSEDCGKELRRSKEDGEDPMTMVVRQEEPHFLTNGFTVENHVIDRFDDVDEDGESFEQNHLNNFTDCINHTHTKHQQHLCNNMPPTPTLDVDSLPNGLHEPEPRNLCVSSTTANSPACLPDSKVTDNNDFLSQYYQLMLSLGVEPDCDDFTNDMDTFSRRVQALRKRLKEDEEKEFSADFGFSCLSDDAEEEGEAMEEMEEEVEEEEARSSTKTSSRRRGVPFTGLF